MLSFLCLLGLVSACEAWSADLPPPTHAPAMAETRLSAPEMGETAKQETELNPTLVWDENCPLRPPDELGRAINAAVFSNPLGPSACSLST